MDGVILFADDHIFDNKRLENLLFTRLNQNSEFSILPIDNLTVLEKSLSSISTFKALILDWNFNRPSIDEDIKLPDENPFDIIKNNRVYSLIYVYSEKEVGHQMKSELLEIYGDKIQFANKINDVSQLENELTKIKKDISDFEKNNQHLNVPFIWGQTINKSIQSIFSTLEIADKYWIKDLFYSSFFFDKNNKPIEPPPTDPASQVITLFQNLLKEELLKDTILRKNIELFSKNNLENQSLEKSLQTLYKKLYYTRTLETDSIMTGDIYQISDMEFGIIISPECDINILIQKDKMVELLCFEQDDFKHKIGNFCSNGKSIKRAYNQENSRIHLLPVFQISSTEFKTALIDFRFSLQHFKGSYLEKNKKNRKFQINSPYIQQLRQRYLSYIGRVGVPAIPDIIKTIK